MSLHSFDPTVAAKVGINAAVIYQNILFWTEKNAANDRNVQDEKVWTYNSIKAWSALFPYMSQKQIRTALDRLVDDGFIYVGNYNKSPYDRTKWYGVDRSVHLPSRANLFALGGEPIPDSKPDHKLDTPIVPKGDLFSAKNQTEEQDGKASDLAMKKEQINKGFEQFWTDWPKHTRKAGKADCRKVYAMACLGTHKKADGTLTPDQINRAAKAYIASFKGDLTYLKGPLPWLRQPGWEPYLGADQFSESDLTDSQRSMLMDGICPPSMKVDGEPNEAARYWIKRFGGEK